MTRVREDVRYCTFLLNSNPLPLVSQFEPGRESTTEDKIEDCPRLLSTSYRYQAARTTERSIGHSRPVSAIQRVPVRVELFD
jgi:hypothetical protein